MIDYTTLALVLVIMIAFCLPFVIASNRKKRHERDLTQRFLNKGKELQLEIHTYDLWRRKYAIGIDKGSSRLLYMNFEPESQMELIELKDIKKVRIQEEHRECGTDKERIVVRLWLSFNHKDSKVPDTLLKFYDAEETLGLMGEPLLIKKWQNLIMEIVEGLDKQVPTEKNLLISS